MIFVTIGLQFSFDRLIKAMDQVAPFLNGVPIIAQVSESTYKVNNMKTLSYIPPADFNSYLSNAQLIVSHAGMGTILSALELGRPILVLPRLTKYGEVKSDHQLATAKYFEKQNYIHVAYHECELKNKLITILNGNLEPLHKINKYASIELIDSIKSFISS
jgi:UDP-N-acetylglucosamine transferase subunit ALG13